MARFCLVNFPHGGAWLGVAGLGVAWRGMARICLVNFDGARRGAAWSGGARRGEARLGQARRGLAGHGWAGLGRAMHGKARRGKARQGIYLVQKEEPMTDKETEGRLNSLALAKRELCTTFRRVLSEMLNKERRLLGLREKNFEIEIYYDD